MKRGLVMHEETIFKESKVEEAEREGLSPQQVEHGVQLDNFLSFLVCFGGPNHA